MAPHPIPLPCALPSPPSSHRDAATPSPCWAPHFMTQERIMFSNPTPSELQISRRDDERCHAIGSHSDLALRLSCSLQHLLKLSLLSLRPSLLQFVSIVSPHSPSLCLGLPALQPSRRHHAQSLLGPSFHDPGTHHVLESHPKQAALLSRREDERCHAIVSHSILALRLHLAPAAPPQGFGFES